MASLPLRTAPWSPRRPPRRRLGRDPGDVLRIAQLVGTITDTPGDRDATEAREGSAPVRGTAEQWAALIARLATEQPFRCFIFWPEQGTVDQVGRAHRLTRPRTTQRG